MTEAQLIAESLQGATPDLTPVELCSALAFVASSYVAPEECDLTGEDARLRTEHLPEEGGPAPGRTGHEHDAPIRVGSPMVTLPRRTGSHGPLSPARLVLRRTAAPVQPEMALSSVIFTSWLSVTEIALSHGEAAVRTRALSETVIDRPR